MLSDEQMARGDWRACVVADAHSWIGTPYVHRGRIKGVAADCGGLLYEVYNPYFNFRAPYPDNYPPDWSLHRDTETYLDFIRPYVVPVPSPTLGGISVFRMGRAFSHGAIFVGDDSYIHSFGRQRNGTVMKSKRASFSGRLVQHFDLKWPS